MIHSFTAIAVLSLAANVYAEFDPEKVPLVDSSFDSCSDIADMFDRTCTTAGSLSSMASKEVECSGTEKCPDGT